MDRFIQLGMAASIEAIKDSGLTVTETNAERIGVHLGSGIGGVETIEATTRTICRERPAAGIAVFRADEHHQHDLRRSVDHVRPQGAQSGHGHGLRHRHPRASAMPDA